MKYLMSGLFVLLFSSIMFSQTDTLISIENISYPCYISNITDQTVKIFHKKSKYTIFNLKQLNSVFIKNYGEVYTLESGFNMNLDSLQTILENRENFRKQMTSSKEYTMEAYERTKIDKHEQSKFSFGIFYIPYSLNDGDVLMRYYDLRNNPYYYILEKNNSIIEYYLAYKIKNNASLQFSFTYNSNNVETYEESHYEQKDPFRVENHGNENNSSLDMLTFEISLKFFLMETRLKKISPFIIIGMGKTFAWATEENKVLFPSDNNTYKETNNFEEYLEDLNSPFLINLGGGVEYFFNKSISIYSSVMFAYYYTDSEYKSTWEDDYSKSTNISKRETSGVRTKVGIGLNFFF